MHFRIIHITLLAIALALAFSVSPSPAQDVFSHHELDLLQLINQARENPLGVAESLGIDRGQVLSDLPELEDILIYGLPALRFNENLYAAASAHTHDMLENNYYSHTSLAGRTYYDRIVESDYDPVTTGESLGMLAFSNFIKPAEAVALIFENMFRDELDPSRTEKRNILNPELKEVGVSSCAGTFNLDGLPYNVYLTTCDFASSEIYAIELELLALINQAREDPLAMASSLGMNTEQILQDFPELEDILIYGLPPLSFNRNLYAAAGAHAQDMLANGYYSHTSLDGRTYDDRVREHGYLPLVTVETIGSLATGCSVRPAHGARQLFEMRFKDELNPDSIEERNILNQDSKEAGISFAVATSNEGEELCSVYHLLVCDFGASIIEEDPALTGVVYSDLDQNAIYSIGEGLQGIFISIQGADTTIDLITNQAGGFSIRLEPGVYWVMVYLPDDQVKVEMVELAEVNKALWFMVE